jgi:hypothetical protein
LNPLDAYCDKYKRGTALIGERREARKKMGNENDQVPETPVVLYRGISGWHGSTCVLAVQFAHWHYEYTWLSWQF